MWWSYLLAAVGVLGLHLAGKKRSIGWLINLSAQALWIAYAIATQQYGFIISALAYATVYFNNYRKWRNENDSPHADDPALRVSTQHGSEGSS